MMQYYPQSQPGMMPPGYMPSQPGMMQPGMVMTQGHHGHGGAVARPHARINPSCHKCHGTGWNSHKGKACGKCVCKKCGGSGWNAHKNKVCKKMHIKG